MAKRQKLCEQMVDVIQRSGTGLERCTHWKSAPGTLDPSGVSKLSGNSANAEVVAKDRVNTVSHPVLLYSGLSDVHQHRHWSYSAGALTFASTIQDTSWMAWLVMSRRPIGLP